MLDWSDPTEYPLAKRIFTDNFMPYAKHNWTYGSGPGLCNCEELAEALQLTWIRVKQLTNHAGVSGLKASKDSVAMVILKEMDVFHIADGARGNVKKATGVFTGKCYFPIHYFCKIDQVFFDPTFSRWTLDKEDKVDRHVRKGCPRLLMSDLGPTVYVRSVGAVPGFVDSWYELSLDEALEGAGGVVPVLSTDEKKWIKYFLEKKWGSVLKPYRISQPRWSANNPTSRCKNLHGAG